MGLNLKFYTGKDEYSDGEVEDEIINYIKKYPNDYEEAFKENSSWPVLYHLSNMRTNIISWYPFKENCTILEVGAGMGAITGELCKHAKKVTSIELSKRRATAIDLRNKNNKNLEIIVGNFKDIKLEEKYDYVILNGVFEYSALYMDTSSPFVDMLNKIKNYLKKDGKILLSIENRFGLKYWCGANEDHTGIAFDGINNYQSNSKIRTFSKNELIGFFNETNLQYNFYYVFPDYKFPQVFYTDESLKNNFFSNYNAFLSSKMNNIISENKLYLDLYRNDMIPFFSNSFFIELCNKKIENEISFVKYNNDYRNEYNNLITYVKHNKVYKRNLHEKGKQQIENIIKIGNILVENKLDCSRVFKEETGCIYSNIIEGENLEEELIRYYYLNNIQIIEKYFDKIFLLIKKSSGHIVSHDKQNIFNKFKINVSIKIIKKLNFYSRCLIDIIPNNIIISNNKMYLIDQEWLLDNCPIEYAMYRAINSFASRVNDIKLRNKLLKKYGINLDIFQKLDKCFFDSIVSKSYKTYLSYYSKNNIISISDLIETLNNKDNYIEELKKNQKNEDIYIKSLEKNQIQANTYISELECEIRKISLKLEEILNSKRWKVIDKIGNLKNKIKK